MRVEEAIERGKTILALMGYELRDVTAKDLAEYMSAETFAPDATTLEDLLVNDYLLIHELVEINEWKLRGYEIHGRLIVDSPRTLVYEIHYIALRKELDYALVKGDRERVEERLRDLEEDEYMPPEFKEIATRMLRKYRALSKP